MASGDTWRKATASGGSGGGGCVEVRCGADPDTIEVRDSKDPDGSVLTFTRYELACFADGLVKGEFADLI